jgi:hypothetical protein
MLPKLPAVLVVCLAAGCAQVAPPDDPAVQPRESDTLRPDELGIGKYVFETKLPAGKVMVLRHTRERDGRPDDEALESISFAGGKATRQVVLVYDSSSFPFGDGKTKTVRVQAQGGGGEYSNSRCNSQSIDPGRLTLEITNDGGQKHRLTYTCFVEDYAVAKKRVPTLPEMSPTGWWTYNARLKAK